MSVKRIGFGKLKQNAKKAFNALILFTLLSNPNVDIKLSKYKNIKKLVDAGKVHIFKPKISTKNNAKLLNIFKNKMFIVKKLKIAFDIYNNHEETLKKAEEKYNIPATILASVLAIESSGGKKLGSYRLIDVIVSRYLYDKRRKRLWKNEIKILDNLIGKGFDPFVRCSYAGAFGIPQFLPSSYIHYAVDFDKDGKKDLFDMDDAIASTANYLKMHGGDKDIKKALFSYNHSKAYVNAVLKISNYLKKLI